MSRSRRERRAPNVSRSISHIRNVRAATTTITSTSLERRMPPGRSCSEVGPDDETPMMKSRMPCQVAKPEMASSMSEARPISALRPNR